MEPKVTVTRLLLALGRWRNRGTEGGGRRKVTFQDLTLFLPALAAVPFSTPNIGRKGVVVPLRVILGASGLPITLLMLSLFVMGSDQSRPALAQSGSFTVCPQGGRWAMSVWIGADDTPTGEGVATCPRPGVKSVWWLNPDDQLWVGYVTDPAIPEIARGKVTTLVNIQPVVP